MPKNKACLEQQMLLSGRRRLQLFGEGVALSRHFACFVSTHRWRLHGGRLERLIDSGRCGLFGRCDVIDQGPLIRGLLVIEGVEPVFLLVANCLFRLDKMGSIFGHVGKDSTLLGNMT